MNKNRFLVVWSVLVITASLAWAGGKDEANASEAFSKLKSLVGQWEANTDKGKITSTYELVSNGTTLVEHLNVPGEDAMLTVYHLDDGRLVLTHYCSAGNQPHMQAKAFNPESNRISFDFVNAGNLSNPADGHMHSVEVSFIGPDAFNSDWTFYKDGKPAFTEPIKFRRVR